MKKINVIKHSLTSLIIFCSLSFLTSIAYAEDNNKVGFGLGLTDGGETLASATLVDTNTRNQRTDSVKAGGAAHFWMGYMLPMTENADLQVTLGYYVDDITAEDASVKFDRFPLDLITRYRFEHIGIGAGLTYHINPAFTTSGRAGDTNVKFENALGYVMAVSYYFSGSASFELRRTIINYVAFEENGNAVDGREIDGNSWGLYVSVYY